MAAIDERVARLVSALDRGGADGLANVVRSRIEAAEAASYDDFGDEERDPAAPPPSEGPAARRRRQLAIADDVVERVLTREIALVPAIDEQLAALRARDGRSGTSFAVKEVAVSFAAPGAEEPAIVPIGERRVAALRALLEAWRAALGMAGEAGPDDAR